MLSSSTSSDKPRVLLVDDNEAMLVRTAAVLAQVCDVVGTARNGLAAGEAAGKLRPDVIVLDISMPGMTGIELAIRLREAGSNAALVFLTVHDEEELILAAQDAGRDRLCREATARHRSAACHPGSPRRPAVRFTDPVSPPGDLSWWRRSPPRTCFGCRARRA